MSGRCKACNDLMSEEDMCRKGPPDPDGKRDYTELCGHCHEISMNVVFNTFYEGTNNYDEFLLYGKRTVPKVSE